MLPVGFNLPANLGSSVAASSSSGSSRTTDGCLCRKPAARGDVGLALGDIRAGFLGGGSSFVSTGGMDGRCFFIFMPVPGSFVADGPDTGMAACGLLGTILRVAGS